jgi:hypothetical protein
MAVGRVAKRISDGVVPEFCVLSTPRPFLAISSPKSTFQFNSLRAKDPGVLFHEPGNELVRGRQPEEGSIPLFQIPLIEMR